PPGTRATIVVLNNGGGGIFDLLPHAVLPEHEALFVTPHGRSFEALAEAAGCGYALASRGGDVVPVAMDRLATGGIHLVEVPIDRRAALRTRERVRDEVRLALERAASAGSGSD